MPQLNPRTEAWQSLAAVADGQSAVVTYGQAQAAGLPDDLVRRLIAHGRWRVIHRGVYLTYPGLDGLLPRMWAAHLAVGPGSVVGGQAAGRYWGLVEGNAEGWAGSSLRLLVAESKRARIPGLEIRRVLDPLARAHPARLPRVLTVEETVLDLVGLAATDMAAVDIPMRACRAGLTTPDRIVAAVGAHARVRRRRLLLEVCAEVDEGITSPLEKAYLRAVARPHGLPPSQRQVRGATLGGGAVFRDLLYERWGAIVELDGRRGHDDEAGLWRDQLRDNSASLSGLATLRFGWRAVIGQPCVVAEQVAGLLQLRGWTGSARPCRPGCVAALPPVSPLPGAQSGIPSVQVQGQVSRFVQRPGVLLPAS